MQKQPSFIRAGAAQINTTVGDLEGNAQKIIASIRQARQQGVQILAFPELALCGYPPKDLLLKTQFIADQQRTLDQILPETHGMLVVVGLVIREGDSYNAAAVMHDGNLVGIARKVGLPNYRVFDEKRYFNRGEFLSVFKTDIANLGVLICEDLWHPETVANVAKSGIDLLVCLSASPYHIGRGLERETLVKSRCQDHFIGVIFCNQVGGQDELIFDGRSLIVSPRAEILAQGKAFAEDLIIGEFHFEEIHRGRLAVPIQRDMVPEAIPGREEVRIITSQGKTTAVETAPPLAKRIPTAYLPQRYEVRYDPIEDAYNALVLGLRDYVYKNGFTKVAIGLSGGIDSALTAVLAVDALGSDAVLGVSMPSRYSSDHSKSDAETLAQNLGIQYKQFEIESTYAAFLFLLQSEFQTTKPDITEENLQSRIRGTLLMALSNKFGHLVLATGNKSEMSVGYSTLYGDMCGGLAVIADVFKTLVYAMARYRNTRAGYDLIPENTILKPPSAELRENQLDTDSLPDYDVLDGILHAYIEKDMSIAEIVTQGYAPETVRHIINLVDRAEYKRQQAAIVLRITAKAFGSDRRLPVTNKYRA
ncbi:MAG: NAD+ synthase [bacterium]|jgi:NAD+ synthase (glutamine-hydrolysing)|nr:NAD+ synthase [bacterium]